MSLAEHIAQLLQLASADPQTTTRDLAILNLVAELAQAVHLAQLLSADPKTGVLDPAIINTLAKHIVHLRQLVSADPELSLLDVAIINVLAELAEAVEDLRANHPPRER